MGKGVAPGEAGTGFKIVPIFANEAKPYLTKDYIARIEDCIRQRTPIAGYRDWETRKIGRAHV